ncbi:hypothetical protein N752_09100 [Desulforamulus aquiferis]|nr:Mur ligase domain-containing protein [Desulforamulus aquiferis]RYD05492.1 hypothetical protein N752_09100 [Desulforamulus aquiferis]
MLTHSIKEIAEITGGTILQGNPELSVSDVSIDSRKIKEGEGTLFVALKGIQVDGHSFINQALEAGASAVLISQK